MPTPPFSLPSLFPASHGVLPASALPQLVHLIVCSAFVAAGPAGRAVGFVVGLAGCCTANPSAVVLSLQLVLLREPMVVASLLAAVPCLCLCLYLCHPCLHVPLQLCSSPRPGSAAHSLSDLSLFGCNQCSPLNCLCGYGQGHLHLADPALTKPRAFF